MRDPDVGLTARRTYAWLAVGLMAFALYVSLLPFRLESVPLDLAWQDFTQAMARWPRRLPRANFLANLLLFVPIGFALAGARLADKPAHRRRAAVMAVMVGALLASVAVSLTAEFLQVFAPRRVVSRADVVAQTMGCAVGLVVWVLSGQAATTWIRESRAHTHHHRLTRVLVGYVALWTFANLAPFDITLDPERLARRLREGSIAVVPFAQPFTPRLWWDAVVTAVSGVPIGMLAVSGWWTRVTRRGAAAAIVLGVCFLTVVEAAQVFIRSHAADTTDILCGALGVAAGVYVGTRMWRAQQAQSAGGESALGGWAWAALGLWCLMMAGYHWQPFDFAIDEDLIRGKAARLSLLPFVGWQSGSDLAAFNNLVAKVGTALPLGLIAAFALPPGMGVRLMATVWVVISGMVFGAIETGQFFLPSRVPGITDVWVGMAASAVGLWLGRWLRAGYKGGVSGRVRR